MKPSARGKIDRRILINFSADPEFVRPLVPDQYGLQLANSRAVVGICLIRLKGMRPKFAPPVITLNSENIAHRIAVELSSSYGERSPGVYVPIRHTNSRITSTIGSRFFSGIYHLADFEIIEGGGNYHVKAQSKDKTMDISIDATITENFTSSLFSSLQEASRFFQCGSVGFSPDRNGCEIEGVKLSTEGWNMNPLKVNSVYSSFYADEDVFPKGSIEFDSALIMRDLPVAWDPVAG